MQVHQFPLPNPQHKITLSPFVFGFFPLFFQILCNSILFNDLGTFALSVPSRHPKASPLSTSPHVGTLCSQPAAIQHRALSTGHFYILACTRLCEKSFSAACWDLPAARDYFNTSQPARVVRPGAKSHRMKTFSEEGTFLLARFPFLLIFFSQLAKISSSSLIQRSLWWSMESWEGSAVLRLENAEWEILTVQKWKQLK